MLWSIKRITLGELNSITRIAFRYGRACLTECPQAVVELVAESDRVVQCGYSGDCLPPLWFDKSPGKSFEQQLHDMYAAFQTAARCWAESFDHPRLVFDGWLEAHEATLRAATEQGLPPLLASFGSSLMERALVDAVCRAIGLSFFDAVRLNVFGIRPEQVHPELAGQEPRHWLPARPHTRIAVRHTVGLADPLTEAELAGGSWPQDGFPVAVETYVRDHGVRFVKVKLSGQADRDLERLEKLAELLERYRQNDYGVTVDGNELYGDPDEFLRLIEAMRRSPRLKNFWSNTLAIEQPLPRDVAFDKSRMERLADVLAEKPVIIDESDCRLDSFRQAAEVGYRGVSSKNCKGTIKSLLNAGYIAWHNHTRKGCSWIMTGEDLCSVGIIPVQADLCLAAALGLEHVERNGHHYHRGLSYLPRPEQEEALIWHGDFYAERAGRISPNLIDGEFSIGSLQCAGFGFAVVPRMSERRCRTLWESRSV
ncbi:MAG: mandelate racemase [Pirellulaceae bacterium]|nr:MAG: mandelate racemase [Pirellulaceae bacterium]